MKVSSNLLAGLANSIWSALITFAVVPVYLNYLGAESYGLIGFFTTTQALIVLLDLGLSSTINREIARSTNAESRIEAAHLLHTLAVIYWVIALLIAIVVFGISPLIANHWLQSDQLSAKTVSHAIMLIGFVIAFRWPIALYQGALIGSQRLSLQSIINIIMVTLSHLGAVAVLVFISPTIEAYFIWQAIVGIIYVVTIRMAAWKVVGKPKDLAFSTSKLKNIWRFSLGMSGIGLTSLVFTQLDKVILSRMLGLEQFGHYMLATLLVSGMYLLIIPVYNVIYPRFSALVASNETDQLIKLYRNGTRALTTVLFPIAMILSVFSESILRIWTGSIEIAANVAPIVSILTIGSALHGAMFFPYALQLANGMSKLALTINVILMLALGPLIIFLTLRLGVLGSAAAWLIVQIIYLFLGAWLTHKYLLKNLNAVWLIQDVLVPFIISLIIGFTTYYCLQISSYNLREQILLAMCALVISFSLSLMTSTIHRQYLTKAFSHFKLN
ncbi:MAG: oligosaccharide flippase family protein [Methylotenera sp.]|nr:oligosaccharide flippase family protein [Methylotenera sp.]